MGHQRRMAGLCHLPQDLVDMHPAMAVCFFRAVRSSWHQVLLLQTSQTCYCGALSLAEIPAWHAAAPASAVLPANNLTLLYHEGFHILTMKNASEFFTIRVQKGSLSRRWLLRTWQSFEAAHGVFRHHTVLKNRAAQGLASVLAGPSLKNN